MVVSVLRNLCCLSAGKKINFILHVFLEILLRYWKFVSLGTLSMPGYAHQKWYYQLVENIRAYQQAKKSTSFSLFFWTYCKDMQTYFGYFGYACLPTPKMIVSIFKHFNVYLHAASSFTFFLRCYILKNSAIWLAKSILAHNSRTRILPDVGLVTKYQLQY